uniref:Uncharacterized protein LOC111116416 n=1 Tax=Crassostrea virginica TaxID=6565 RepID=A0A8B8C682_CRAVI|nr:uncharacterized protein LOC111116416 [Crassostrea virginica]XP_022331822.1 uncharacterized protein LOC111129654 [Crassostrea virginica]
MHQTAKKEYSEDKLYRRQTGGGPCPKPVSSISEKIVDLFKGSGFETQSDVPPINSPNTVNLLSDLLVTTEQQENNSYMGLRVIEVEQSDAEDTTTTSNVLAQFCSHIGGLLMYLHHLHFSQITLKKSVDMYTLHIVSNGLHCIRPLVDSEPAEFAE